VLKKAAVSGIAILLLAVLFYLSLRRPHTYGGPITHRVAHVGAFGALSLLVLPLARSRRQIWLITAAIFCLGCGMEMLQYHAFHFARAGQPLEWWDIRDNTVGILLALLAVRYTRLRT
jgi:TRAP-type uncharacterized transport system fused permease subunit